MATELHLLSGLLMPHDKADRGRYLQPSVGVSTLVVVVQLGFALSGEG
jgi:hypothetical protein